jgi:hypothetical protein
MADSDTIAAAALRDREFRNELDALINRFSRENGSNTPDFILGTYLRRCLDAYNEATRARDEWYGVKLVPGMSHFEHDK